ncbi:50S ribosomal protein L4 [bioreactor metagenome]|uniref:50S ribosomal protein L4 n=1 Tax=bioreactor metagenome TaxID=1076179 RepID=A0A645G5W3_9ZZZZ
MKLALRRAFSERVVDGGVTVLDAFALPDRKTRNAAQVLRALKAEGPTLLAVPEYEENTVLATDNIASLLLIKATSVNVYDLLRYDKLIFTKDALDAFIGRLN